MNSLMRLLVRTIGPTRARMTIGSANLAADVIGRHWVVRAEC